MQSTKPTTVDEYMKSAPTEAHDKLLEMRKCVNSAAPDATESLRWGMPSLSYKRILVTYAGFRHHIGFYPTPSALKAFESKLSGYKKATGSIQFPLDKPLPLTLIKEITEYRANEAKSEDKKWRQKV